MGGGVGQRVFHAADAAEIPGRGHELVEQSLLNGALGADVCFELRLEFFEFFAVFESQDDFGGGESVFARVLGGAGLAFFSTRSGAEERVDGIRDLTCFG